MDKRELRTIDGREVRCIVTELEFREAEGDQPARMIGHAAIFNSFSEDLGFREIIRPGAFKNSLSRNPDVRFLINHEGLPLARTKSGTLRLFEDARGLKMEASIDNSDPDVLRIMPKIKRGDLNQMSFAFRTIKDVWRIEDGIDVRELHEVDINDGDVSIVTYPAYTATDIALRSRDAWKKTQEIRGVSLESVKRKLDLLNL